ncbi:MAG TPA: type II toxin-antitoxin system VapC family toxin [Spirochaetales bacterium]|nr:type II toxin-antitoxin system VapC family toxin [Spirochaetales bacterium]
MVIDTSAVLAILLGEEEAEQFAKAIAADHKRLMSAFSALETGIVIEARKGPAGAREWDVLLHQAAIDIIPFTSDQYTHARRAWRRYGKGKHAAAFNIGDCCSYALSRFSDEPLLFKGNNFNKTDLKTLSF